MFGSSIRLEDLALFPTIRLVRIFRKVWQVSGEAGVSFVEAVTTMFAKSMKGRLAVIIVAAFIQTAAFSSSSQAAFVLMLDDPDTFGIDAMITDNMFGDGNPADGIIQYGGVPSSAWSINVTTGLSKPLLINPAKPNVVKLDLFSVLVGSTGPGTLEITLTDTDYMLPMTDRWIFRHLLGGTTSGTVIADTYYDLANAEFGMGSTLGTLGPFGPGAFSGTAHLQINPVTSDPFSMTQRVTIVHTGAFQVTSFDSELVATAPEPGALGLFGLGLAGLGFARRKRAA